jgi:1-acyl-sn-glycerol-3-phosphate acyltransferase
MISALAIFLCYAILSPIDALIGFPWTWITGDITLLYRSAMWTAALGLRMAGIRVDAVGLENVPRNTACIFMANHVSNLDPPVFLPLIPGRTAVFIKRELVKIPFIGRAMLMGGFVPVDRSGSREAAIESIRQAAEVLASGVHITSFPEGTRSRTGQLLPFKKGPFYLAQQTNAPVLPVSISGTEGMMRKGSVTITPATARVEFHPPIVASDYQTREDLMAAVRAAIASGLPEWMRG